MERLNKCLLVAQMPFACGSDFSRDGSIAALQLFDAQPGRAAHCYAVATEVASTK
jgi:hypothetical protein